MYNFVYNAPTKVYFGRDALGHLGEALSESGCKRVLLHYGCGSAERSGLLSKVRAALSEAGVEFCELGGVKPNPRLSLAYEGVRLCRERGVDLILAVGGGSVIDSAKAIGLGVADGGDLWDFYVGKRTPDTCLPVGVILTLSATGSEMSNSSVITKAETKEKRGCNCEHIRPRFALCDPSLTFTADAYQTACGCTDILMHTMERYFVSDGTMALTDGLAEALMRTVISKTRRVIADPQDYAARAEIMWAGSLSHNGLTGCGSCGGDWTVHRMEHELSGLYDVAHGAGLAAIWGSWARFVYKNCLNRFHDFAVNVMRLRPGGTREEMALNGIEAFEGFLTSIGMPVGLKGLGICPDDRDIRYMAHCAAEAWGGVKGSAKPLDEDAVYAILTDANER